MEIAGLISRRYIPEFETHVSVLVDILNKIKSPEGCTLGHLSRAFMCDPRGIRYKGGILDDVRFCLVVLSPKSEKELFAGIEEGRLAFISEIIGRARSQVDNSRKEFTRKFFDERSAGSRLQIFRDVALCVKNVLQNLGELICQAVETELSSKLKGEINSLSERLDGILSESSYPDVSIPRQELSEPNSHGEGNFRKEEGTGANVVG